MITPMIFPTATMKSQTDRNMRSFLDSVLSFGRHRYREIMVDDPISDKKDITDAATLKVRDTLESPKMDSIYEKKTKHK